MVALLADLVVAARHCWRKVKSKCLVLYLESICVRSSSPTRVMTLFQVMEPEPLRSWF